MDKQAVEQEIKNALNKAAKGLTARQLHDECDGSDGLKEILTVINDMKSAGTIKADGIRENQVLYKLGGKSIPSVSKPGRRSASGLREGLFEMMEQLRAGNIDVPTAKTYAALAMTICKSIEVQLEYERMRLSNEIPGDLADMTLVPALEDKS